MMVVVGGWSGARLMFIRHRSPAPLAHHHSTQLARASVSKCYSAAPHASARGRQIDELGLLRLKVYGEFGERPGCHFGHLLYVATLLPTEVQELLNLPQENTDGEEKEKAGEENGEKDKKVYVGLVLSQKQETLRFSVMVLSSHASQSDVEATRFQGVHFMREGYDHTVSNSSDYEHSLWFPHSYVGNESLGTLLPDFPLCSWRLGLQLQWRVGKHRTPQAG